MTEKNIAVIGAGYWGKNLVRNFHQLGVLKTICDGAAPIRAEMYSAYPDAAVTADIADILNDPAITGVVIAAPAACHYDIASLALAAGKHVFVEKPLSLTYTDGEALVRQAAQARKTLFVGHILHYHAAVVRLKEMIRAGKIGRLQYIYSRRLSLGKIRREENILWSFAPHDISLILSLTGEEPCYVDSVGNNFLHARIPDVTMTNLKFPSGIGAHIFVSWLNPYKEQKLVIVGSSGMLVFDDTEPVERKLVHYPHTIHWENGLPVPNKAEGRPIDIAPIWKEPLKAECEAFLTAIAANASGAPHVTGYKAAAGATNAAAGGAGTGDVTTAAGAPPLTSGEEGLRVLKILELSQQSLEQKENFHGVLSMSGPVIPRTSSAIAAPSSAIAANAGIHSFQELLDSRQKNAGMTEEGAGIQEGNRPAKAYPGAFIHPTAIVDDNVAIGAGAKIWHFSHVLSGSTIGENCNIGQNVVIGPDAAVGARCKIQNNVSVYKGVTLEDGVFCGPSMVFTNIYNPRAEIGKMDQVRPTLVKRGATLGANCTIVCGHTIGRYAFIGAGAVVTKDVPDHALMVGNPARRIGWVCECGERLPADLQCPSCGKTLKVMGSGLEN